MADFDPSTPSIARVYDYFPGGRDNFAADRASGPPKRDGEMIVGVAQVS